MKEYNYNGKIYGLKKIDVVKRMFARGIDFEFFVVGSYVHPYSFHSGYKLASHTMQSKDIQDVEKFINEWEYYNKSYFGDIRFYIKY